MIVYKVLVLSSSCGNLLRFSNEFTERICCCLGFHMGRYSRGTENLPEYQEHYSMKLSQTDRFWKAPVYQYQVSGEINWRL